MALVFISWILGLILSYGVLSLVAKSVFEPMGQMLSIVSIQSLLYTIIVMAVFVVVTILVTILKFAKKDLIAIIEMR
jgi:ABC-type antimicrobial peptide transport system permease subunit